MSFILIISILSVLLTFLESKNKIQGGLKLAFIIMTVISAIRYNYGTDYLSYFDKFYINASSFHSIKDLLDWEFLWKEPLWVIMDILFGKLGGFFVMTAFVSIVQGVIYYYFIKTNLDKKYWWIGMAIYLFNPNFFLLSMSMQRQALVMSLLVLAWIRIDEHKIPRAILLILASILIHKSAIFVLPFFFFIIFPPKNGKVIAASLISGLAIFFINREFLGQIYNSFMAVDAFSGYEHYEMSLGSEVTFGMGYLINLIPFIVYLFCVLKKEILPKQRAITAMTCVGYVLAPATAIVGLLGRLAYYFDIFSVVVLPRAYSEIVKNKVVRMGLYAIFFFMTLLSYFSFYDDPSYHEWYSTYQTIFSVIL